MSLKTSPNFTPIPCDVCECPEPNSPQIIVKNDAPKNYRHLT